MDVNADLDVINEALDRVGQWEVAALADPETVIALQRITARAESLLTRSVAAFDAASNFTPQAYSAVHWITARCRIPRNQAKRQVRRGRELRYLPETTRAWEEGDITGAQADVMIALRRDETEAALARDEAVLVGQAKELTFEHFSRSGAYWRQLADPRGTDRDAARQEARRDGYLVKSFSGMLFGAMTLDPVGGTIVAEELGRLSRELFEADRAKARAALGRDPGPGDKLARTPGQHFADALVEMAIRSKSCPSDARRPAPLFTVLVGWETVHGRLCELENGTVLPPGTLPAWLDGADVERATFHPGGRVTMACTSRLSAGISRRVTAAELERATFDPRERAECSPTNRFSTWATRRAIEVRDRECTHPLCDVTAASCQVDHIQPWALGGATTQENGRLLCPRHNGQRNERPPPRSPPEAAA